VSEGSHSTELALFEFGSIENPKLLTRSYFINHTINITNKLPYHRQQAVQPEMTDYNWHSSHHKNVSLTTVNTHISCKRV